MFGENFRAARLSG